MLLSSFSLSSPLLYHLATVGKVRIWVVRKKITCLGFQFQASTQMAWCKDYCLICERETRVEHGLSVPYCSQACRLADYDRIHESPLNLTSCRQRPQPTSGIMYTRPGTRETYVFPTPPSSPRQIVRAQRSDTSCSTSSASTASEGRLGQTRCRPEASLHSGHNRRGGVDRSPPSSPFGLSKGEQLYDPLGRTITPELIRHRSTSQGSNATAWSGPRSERSSHLERYTSFFDQARHHKTRFELPTDVP